MKLNRSLPCMAATIACLLMPITVVYGQTPTTVATGSITCDMVSRDLVTDQVTTEISTFDQVALIKYGDGSYGVLSRWGGTEEVMYSIFIQDTVLPVGTTVAPISGSFIGEDGGTWDIEYDELGQLTFKLDKRGRLSVTGTSFATPVNYFLPVLLPEGTLQPLFGTCTWNLKGNL